MRILNCYIDNFGKLHSVRCELDGGLNMMDAGNGWGKSTFAAFIRAMFYGLPEPMSGIRYDKKDYRRNYKPWQGGNFGGTMTFEYDGRSMRMERYFGDVPAEDRFSLTDLKTGEEILDPALTGEGIGFTIFGIDADGFERSAYIPQNDLEIAENDTIQDRLLSLLEDDESGKHSYRKAAERLDSAMRALDKGDGRGAIAEHRRMLSGLEEELQSQEQRLAKKDAFIRNGNRWKRFLQPRLYEEAATEGDRLRESIPKKRKEVEGAREALKKEEERLRQLGLAKDYLEKARKRLSREYMDRMRRHFEIFLSDITDEPGITLEDDFSISKTTEEETRSIRSLSCGLQDLVQLCARFALIDTLYETDRPPIILDDVMNNLDDRNFERMMRSVKRLSEKGQVIYLTCHTSREVR